MIAFKNNVSGEVHRVRDAAREDYPLTDWTEVPDPGPDTLNAERRRQAAIAAMTPAERFDWIMAEVIKLRERVAALETAADVSVAIDPATDLDPSLPEG